MWYNHHHLQLEYKHDSREKNWTLNYPQQHPSNRSWQFCLISESRSIGQVFWPVSRRFDNKIFRPCLSDGEQNKVWSEAIQVLEILKQKPCLFRSTDCFYNKLSGQGTTCSATHLGIRLHQSNTCILLKAKVLFSCNSPSSVAVVFQWWEITTSVIKGQLKSLFLSLFIAFFFFQMMWWVEDIKWTSKSQCWLFSMLSYMFFLLFFISFHHCI